MTDQEAVAAVMGLITAAMTSPEDLQWMLEGVEEPRVLLDIAIGLSSAMIEALMPATALTLPEFLQQFSAGMQAAAFEGFG